MVAQGLVVPLARVQIPLATPVGVFVIIKPTINIKVMNKKKVLIVSASIGSGHTRAGEALKQNLEKYRADEFIVKHIDLMAYKPKWLSLIFKKGYNFFANKIPTTWSFLYKASNNKKSNFLQNYIYKNFLRKITNTSFYNTVEHFAPDKIICTHFLAPQLLSNKILKNTQLSVIITDYGLHQLWLNKKVDQYFVAASEIKQKIKSKDINPQQVKIINLPVNPRFHEIKNKTSQKIKKQLGINTKKPLVLSLSGGKGLGKIQSTTKKLLSLNLDYSLIAIAGKNKKLKNKLKEIESDKKYKVIGWTDKIERYIKAADVVVSKPGGMTTTECAYLQTPIIAINPIPGQEEENAKYIVRNNLGFFAQDNTEIKLFIKKIINNSLNLREQNDKKLLYKII